MMKEDRNDIGSAIGRIPSGCSILTVQHGNRATGLLVSWVQQAAFDPPSITVCVKGGRPALEMIDGAGCFVLNVIGADPRVWFKHFGKGFALDEDAFLGLIVEQTALGPLLTDCIAHLGCRVRDKLSIGDHELYAAEVVSARAPESPDAAPHVHIRKSGLSY